MLDVLSGVDEDERELMAIRLRQYWVLWIAAVLAVVVLFGGVLGVYPGRGSSEDVAVVKVVPAVGVGTEGRGADGVLTEAAAVSRAIGYALEAGLGERPTHYVAAQMSYGEFAALNDFGIADGDQEVWVVSVPGAGDRALPGCFLNLEEGGKWSFSGGLSIVDGAMTRERRRAKGALGAED